MLGANEILMDAFYTDVRPALAHWRAERGLPADPMARLRRIGLSGQQSTPNESAARNPSWGA